MTFGGMYENARPQVAARRARAQTSRKRSGSGVTSPHIHFTLSPTTHPLPFTRRSIHLHPPEQAHQIGAARRKLVRHNAEGESIFL